MNAPRTLREVAALHPGQRDYYLSSLDCLATRVRSRFVVYRANRDGCYQQVDSLSKLGPEWLKAPRSMFAAAKVTP